MKRKKKHIAKKRSTRHDLITSIRMILIVVLHCALIISYVYYSRFLALQSSATIAHTAGIGMGVGIFLIIVSFLIAVLIIRYLSYSSDDPSVNRAFVCAFARCKGLTLICAVICIIVLSLLRFSMNSRTDMSSAGTITRYSMLNTETAIIPLQDYQNVELRIIDYPPGIYNTRKLVLAVFIKDVRGHSYRFDAGQFRSIEEFLDYLSFVTENQIDVAFVEGYDLKDEWCTLQHLSPAQTEIVTSIPPS